MEGFFAVHKFTIEGPDERVRRAADDLKRAAMKAVRDHGVFITDDGRSPHGPTLQRYGIPTDERVLEQSIDELEFSVRTSRLLGESGVKTIGDLLDLSDRCLLKERGIGKGTLSEIHSKLWRRGLRQVES